MDEKVLAPGLYLVSTPIGNLEDMTLRGLRVLRQADRIACEDTRQTQKLLNHFGIETPTVSYHLFNEASRSAELVEILREGGRIAVVSDAGTPGIADPGAFLVAAAVVAGVAVYPVPGANAVLAALVASGLPAEPFLFHGFLPSRAGERRSTLEGLARGGMTHVFYESPHRVLDALGDLEALFGAGQPLVLARELTKMHEEFLRGPVDEVRAELAGRAQVRGEFVLVFVLAENAAEAGTQTIGQAVAELRKTEGLSEMDALKRVARERGVGKSEAYRELQREQGRGRKG